ncbi:Nudix hydrolase 18, mitochondrial, partial [Ananas comosus]
CIPYKLSTNSTCSDDLHSAVEVLVISSQKGHGVMFPKGGWETDETKKQAALREALEEAGVQGNVEASSRTLTRRRLGKWKYKSRRHDSLHEGIMFPMNVTEELVQWPEMDVRERRWVTVAEAREKCEHIWMREALERLVRRLENSSRN